jgi:phosphoglycolate phosphatase
MTYDAVLFDFDGVIAEKPGRGTFERALARTCDRVGESLPAEATLRRFVEGDFDAIAARCRDVGVDPDRFCAQATVDAIREQWRAVEDGCRSLYEDATAIRALSPALGVVSDNHPTVFSLLLRRFGLRDAFQTVYGCSISAEGLASRKPNPSHLEAAIDDLDADWSVYVGDRPVDVETAAQAGVDSVLVARTADVPETSATHRVSSLRDLPVLIE